MIVQEHDNRPIILGRIGENESRKITFYIGEIKKAFPDATYTLLNKRPSDNVAYPVANTYLEVSGNHLIWTLQSGDLTTEGIGECQIKASESGKIIKTLVWQTITGRALDGSGTPPEPWESWIEEVTDAAQDAEDARDAAEAWATGGSGGTPSATNNAAYYAEQASDSATAAETAQGAAEDARDAAQAAAGDFQGLTASASGLAAGTTPTVNVTHSSGGLYNLAFGIPKGDKGDQGDPAPAASVATAVDAYLDEHITNPDSPPLDRTLSSSSAAAPADMVGDLLSALNGFVQKDGYNEFDQSSNIFTVVNGKYIKANGTEAENSNYCIDYYTAQENCSFYLTATLGTGTSLTLSFFNADGSFRERYNDGSVPTGSENIFQLSEGEKIGISRYYATGFTLHYSGYYYTAKLAEKISVKNHQVTVDGIAEDSTDKKTILTVGGLHPSSNSLYIIFNTGLSITNGDTVKVKFRNLQSHVISARSYLSDSDAFSNKGSSSTTTIAYNEDVELSATASSDIASLYLWLSLGSDSNTSVYDMIFHDLRIVVNNGSAVDISETVYALNPNATAQYGYTASVRDYFTKDSIVNVDRYYGRKIKICCMGDSLTQASSADTGNGYAEFLETSGWFDVTRCGKGGASWVSYYSHFMDTIIPAGLDLTSFDVILVMLGTNYLFNGAKFADARVYLEGAESSYPDGFIYSCFKMLNYLSLHKGEKTKLFVAAPPKFTAPGNSTEAEQEDYRIELEKVLNWYSIPMIDVYGKSVINRINASTYLKSDLLHPNAKGSKAIADLIAAEIKPWFIGHRTDAQYYPPVPNLYYTQGS